MKYLLIVSVLSLTLMGCNILTSSVDEISVDAAPVIQEELPLKEAREALVDDNGEILSTEENMWRNRDENVDSRS